MVSSFNNFVHKDTKDAGSFILPLPIKSQTLLMNTPSVYGMVQLWITWHMTSVLDVVRTMSITSDITACPATALLLGFKTGTPESSGQQTGIF